MGSLHNEIMQAAIKQANERLSRYSETEMREFTFDRLVDEIYAELMMQNQMRFGGTSCPGCGE